MKGLMIFLGLFLGLFCPAFSSYAEEVSKVRTSPIAGAWYPADQKELQKMLKEYLDKAQVPQINDKILAIISPHAGYYFSGKAAAYGFKAIMGKSFDRVIIIGPSHYARFRGICVSSYNYYETPFGRIPVEKRIGEELSCEKLFLLKPEIEAPEHSLEMEIPFLQLVLKDFKIVPLIVGELEDTDYADAAKSIRPYITEKTLVVVSSDFTHFGARFGYLPFNDNIKDNLKKLDRGAVDLILKKDFKGYQNYLEETGATICGRNAIGIVLQVLPPEAQGVLLNYYTSGDLLNDYSDTVSYVSIVFKKGEEKNPIAKQKTNP